MSLHDDEIQLKRLKLKLAINKQLRKQGKMYASQVFHFLRCGDPDFFAGVVEEMSLEGMLNKETSGHGALILVYRDMTQGVDHA